MFSWIVSHFEGVLTYLVHCIAQISSNSKEPVHARFGGLSWGPEWCSVDCVLDSVGCDDATRIVVVLQGVLEGISFAGELSTERALDPTTQMLMEFQREDS